MEKDLKKWKSFEDQLDILESRGLVITNRQAALKYLERLGYYRLSGYWYPFRQNEPKSYIKKLCTRQISQNPYPIRILPS